MTAKPGRFLSPEQLAANAECFTRYQFTSSAVLVESFAVSVAIDGDEPVPYYLEPLGEKVPDVDLDEYFQAVP